MICKQCGGRAGRGGICDDCFHEGQIVIRGTPMGYPDPRIGGEEGYIDSGQRMRTKEMRELKSGEFDEAPEVGDGEES